MEECNVCVEKYNKSTRAKTICPYCAFEACRECCKTWVLGETTARCMSSTCGKDWTRQQLATAMTQVFMKDEYKKHRENILFDQERALLPATQPIVENIIKSEKLHREQEEIRIEIGRLYRKISDIDIRRRELQNGNQYALNQRSVFIKACPDGECRGFLSSQWKCGICEQWTCPECHEIKGMTRDGGDHVCNPDTVATAKLLGNDTKSCPTCGAGIHKLEGCDQMFCTMCHTGFNWKTGRIETNIHNPHYYEWLRRSGGGAAPRNPNEIICGREINHTLVREMTRTMRRNTVPKEIADRVSVIGEAIVHMRYVNQDRYREDRVLNNEQLRITYLRNQISEAEFKTDVQKNDKRFQKNREVFNIIQLFIDTITDIIYRFHSGIEQYNLILPTEQQIVCAILDEVRPITIYANECFRDISRTYNTTRLEINDNLRIYSH
jgi:hypothetical protein